jgi:hypothetical protein
MRTRSVSRRPPPPTVPWCAPVGCKQLSNHWKKTCVCHANSPLPASFDGSGKLHPPCPEGMTETSRKAPAVADISVRIREEERVSFRVSARDIDETSTRCAAPDWRAIPSRPNRRASTLRVKRWYLASLSSDARNRGGVHAPRGGPPSRPRLREVSSCLLSGGLA